MVLRRWPRWNSLAIFGDEYSIITVLFFPVVFMPYSRNLDSLDVSFGDHFLNDLNSFSL
jgi:hypothetical protein